MVYNESSMLFIRHNIIFPYYKYDSRVLFNKYFSMKMVTERISISRKMNRKEINISRQRISKHVTLSTLLMIVIFKVEFRYVLNMDAEYHISMLYLCLGSRLSCIVILNAKRFKSTKCISNKVISSWILVTLAIDSLIPCISYVGINLVVFVWVYVGTWVTTLKTCCNAINRHINFLKWQLSCLDYVGFAKIKLFV